MIGQEEKEAILKLMPFFSEKPVVFDVGSNKGHFADVILGEYGDKCTLHLFEPNKKLLSFTEIKYEYQKNIKYNDVGLSFAEHESEFYYFENENNELSSQFKDESWAGLPMKTRNIQVTTVTDYASSNNIHYIDFVKIDVEGNDGSVLAGCLLMLKEERIKFISIEYSPHWKRAHKDFVTYINEVNKIGYKVYSYSGNYYEVKAETFIEDYHFENFIITKENIHNHSEGWNKEFIINTFELEEVDLALEVGCYEGLTTKHICEDLLSDGGRVICVDPLEDYYTPTDTEHKEMFRQQYQRFIGNTKGLPVELIRKPSDVALPELHELRFGLIYLDGDHSYDSVYRDGVNAFKILKVGGYMIFDDYEWREETKNGINKFLEEYMGFYELITQGYQVMIKKHTDKNG